MKFLKKYSGLLYVLLVAVLLLVGWMQLKSYLDYQAYLKYRKPLMAVEVRDKSPYTDEHGFIKKAPLLSNVPVKLVYNGPPKSCPMVVGIKCSGPLSLVLESKTDNNGLAYFYDVDIEPIISDKPLGSIGYNLEVYIDDPDKYKSEGVEVGYILMKDGFYLNNPIKMEYGVDRQPENRTSYDSMHKMPVEEEEVDIVETSDEVIEVKNDINLYGIDYGIDLLPQ